MQLFIFSEKNYLECRPHVERRRARQARCVMFTTTSVLTDGHLQPSLLINIFTDIPNFLMKFSPHSNRRGYAFNWGLIGLHSVGNCWRSMTWREPYWAGVAKLLYLAPRESGPLPCSTQVASFIKYILIKRAGVKPWLPTTLGCNGWN